MKIGMTNSKVSKLIVDGPPAENHPNRLNTVVGVQLDVVVFTNIELSSSIFC